jgi:uncharacterized membrane protein
MKSFRQSKTHGSASARLARDTRGSVSIIAALSLICLMGMAGLAIDYGRITSTRQELQMLADSALIAAATSARSSQDPQTAADISSQISPTTSWRGWCRRNCR